MWRWFFFSSRRRHTRFDCDWSSDVCSSDLGGGTAGWKPALHGNLLRRVGGWRWIPHHRQLPTAYRQLLLRRDERRVVGRRSEERRVGKECRSRWATDHEKREDDRFSRVGED